MTEWPKNIVEWHGGDQGYLSVPFTWLLPKARARIKQKDLFVREWHVGGPAVKLMPDYLADCDAAIGGDMPGVLQRVNPQATRTTIGCIRRCGFCGVRRIEGDFRELSEWPDQPILCDNNLLAASDQHIERVVRMVRKHGWCDFNQGLDARLLTTYHATLIATVPKAIVRLALDHDRDRDAWGDAVERLLDAGIPKSRIQSYVLCGFDGGPDEDGARCKYVEWFGLKPLPMWFHPLDTLERNPVTDRQVAMGWTHRKRRELMCWYYHHRTLTVRG